MIRYDLIILTESKYADSKTETSDNKTVFKEDYLLLEALLAQGLRCKRIAWDDPDFEWATTRYVLFRSTWDYYYRKDEFLNWLDLVSQKTNLINSENLIRWNIEKHYLIDLQKKGVHIAPTFIIAPGSNENLASLSEKYQLQEFVLKPVFSGAARHTYKINSDSLKNHESTFAALIKEEPLMLQAFQHRIVSEGEKSLMFFYGVYSHAVLKVAKAGDFRVQDDFGGSVYDYYPTEAEIQFARKTLAACPELPVYARVDLFNDNQSQIALAELELIEPELWFRNKPEAAQLLAKTIKDNYS